ncbi:MAG: dihydrofolate reductase [Hyphomicrobiaceae bacterium]|nr:dihydrofolate reductase [Hyphomicrobiaceae bacterium]
MPVAKPDPNAPETTAVATPLVALVVAVAENGVIGRDGTLPWRLSTDLKVFRRLTMGKPIVMGRRTWQSLPKRPLDGRPNIVVTRDPDFEAPGGHVCASLDEAMAVATRLARASGAMEIAVIGGAELYAATVGSADRIYLTIVHAEPEGDRLFPVLSARDWRETSRELLPAGPRDDFAATLTILDRVR